MATINGVASALRVLHISAGFVALLSFWVPLVVQKGSTLHRKVGWVYVVAMFTAAATALLIVPIRLVQRPTDQWFGPIFLAYVALLAFATAFFGVRVLKQKKRAGAHTAAVDFIAPSLLLVASVAIFATGAVLREPLFIAFSVIGAVVALPQLRTMLRPPSEKRWWLVRHLVSMMISTIATLTAFIVANVARVVPGGGLIFWLGPTVVITPLIFYWARLYRTPRGKVAPRVVLDEERTP